MNSYYLLVYYLSHLFNYYVQCYSIISFTRFHLCYNILYTSRTIIILRSIHHGRGSPPSQQIKLTLFVYIRYSTASANMSALRFRRKCSGPYRSHSDRFNACTRMPPRRHDHRITVSATNVTKRSNSRSISDMFLLVQAKSKNKRYIVYLLW